MARCRSPGSGSIVHNTEAGAVIKLYELCKKLLWKRNGGNKPTSIVCAEFPFSLGGNTSPRQHLCNLGEKKNRMYLAD
jgi:hypothetical protein